ncbi:MAG: ABC transporter ATP-binding protein [Gemmatimonadales bacterium]|nr:ABC transporter ATP-binding protein [Gemmatimonadales bacterium]
MSDALVEAERVVKRYGTVCAVDDVSFTIDAGETLALVGESGSGKSTLGRLVLGLEAPTGGRCRVEGDDLATLPAKALRARRRRMQLVPQDPAAALDPRRTIGASVAEGLVIHRLAAGEARRRRVAALLEEVGLDPALAERYPHECSGGQRQRACLARALAVEPVFLVLDEPVTALDVSVQAQVLALLADLQRRRGLAYLFIAHDLAVARQLAARVAVLLRGRVCEEGPAEAVLGRPRHPYTRALRSAVPAPVPGAARERILLRDEPPGRALPAGCRFAGRCWHPAADGSCRDEAPPLRAHEGRRAACHHLEDPR